MNEQQKAMLDRQLKLQRGAAIIEGTQEKFRQDGYSNLLNKYGTAQDSSTSYQYNQEIITNDMELIRLYEGNGLFTKIIDRPSEEAVKHGFDIDFGNGDINQYVDDRMDGLDFEAKFATAEKWARLYGGSIIVMLVDDGRGLEEPLDWANVRTIEELRVFERAIVQPDYTSMYQFHFLDTLNSGCSFAEPEYYQVFSIYGYFTVHRSRCLVFRNGRLPEQTTNAIYRYWGIPEYVKIKRVLRECITSHENGTKLLERCVQAIYKMKNLASLLGTEDGENKVLQRLQIIDMARSIMNSIAIDSEGEDYDFKTFSMAGVKDVLDSTCNMLSAVTEIPQTILFGRSPAGMNATGENDMENYYNMVENIQKQNMKKNSRTVIDLILRQGKLEGKIPEEPKYKVKFAALWSLSDTEKANVDKIKADTEYTKAQTSQIYMDSNVLDPSEVRKSLASEGDFEIEDVLSEEELNLPEDTFDVGGNATVGEPIEILEQTNDEGDTIEIDMPGSQLRTGEKIVVNDISSSEISDDTIVVNMDGGEGSGDWGHEGRPGKIGGSGGGGGIEHRQGTKNSGFTSEAKKKAEAKKASKSNGGKGGGSEKSNSNKKGNGKSESEKAKGEDVDVKSVSKITRSQEYNEWANCDEEDRMAYIEDAKESYPDYGFTRSGSLSNTIAAEEGLDKKPTSLSEKEFDDYVKATGCKKIYRGVDDLEDDDGEIIAKAKDMRKEFSDSDDSTWGGGNYGYGYHFADQYDYARGFAHSTGEVFECAIKPGAKIMDWSVWTRLPESVKSKYDQDPGLFALTNGYDAIGNENGTVYNFVNRQALVYKKPGSQKDNADGAYYPAAAVIIIKDGKILCASRRNNEGVCGPGGHVEEGEEPEDTAVREAMEEFNIVPLNLQPLGGYKGSTGPYLPSMVYWTDQFSGTPEADGDEMLNEQWLSMEELQNKLLFPPFEASLEMLENFLKNYLPTSNSIDTIIIQNLDGGPGSGNFKHGGRPGKIGGSSDNAGHEADFKAAREYTKAVKGTVAANGVVVKSVSGHAGYRMKQRGINADDLVKDLKEPSVTYPGNKKNKDATCFQRGNDRIVLSKDGVVITTVDLGDD